MDPGFHVLLLRGPMQILQPREEVNVQGERFLALTVISDHDSRVGGEGLSSSKGTSMLQTLSSLCCSDPPNVSPVAQAGHTQTDGHSELGVCGRGRASMCVCVSLPASSPPFLPPPLLYLSLSLSLYIYTYTHTHTHIYVYDIYRYRYLYGVAYLLPRETHRRVRPPCPPPVWPRPSLSWRGLFWRGLFWRGPRRRLRQRGWRGRASGAAGWRGGGGRR